MDLYNTIVQSLIAGGPGSVVALLIGSIIFLLWDRKRLVSDNQKKDAKIEKIIEDYYKGNISLTEALNGLKYVLVEIKAKL